MTWKLALPVFPCVSVALHVTVVVPIGNVLPEDGLQLGVSEPSRLSVAVALKLTEVPPGFPVLVVMSLGTLTTGGVVSLIETVTVNEALPVLPCASVALQVTVVVPTGKVLPEAGLQEGVSEPSTTSVADASE